MKVRQVFPSRKKQWHYAVDIGVSGKSYLICKGIDTFGIYTSEQPIDKWGNFKEKEPCKMCVRMAEKHPYITVV